MFFHGNREILLGPQRRNGNWKNGFGDNADEVKMFFVSFIVFQFKKGMDNIEYFEL